MTDGTRARLPEHQVLFCGTREAGKTTLANISIRALHEFGHRVKRGRKFSPYGPALQYGKVIGLACQHVRDGLDAGGRTVGATPYEGQSLGVHTAGKKGELEFRFLDPAGDNYDSIFGAEPDRALTETIKVARLLVLVVDASKVLRVDNDGSALLTASAREQLAYNVHNADPSARHLVVFSKADFLMQLLLQDQLSEIVRSRVNSYEPERLSELASKIASKTSSRQPFLNLVTQLAEVLDTSALFTQAVLPAPPTEVGLARLLLHAAKV